jgi:uncharacterized protein (DUF3084 family)
MLDSALGFVHQKDALTELVHRAEERDRFKRYHDEIREEYMEAEAERDRLRSQLATLQKAWIERGGEGTDRLWDQLQKAKAERDRLQAVAEAARELVKSERPSWWLRQKVLDALAALEEK